MTAAHPVPSDVDADTVIDLVEDCREVSGVLGSFVPTTIVLPEPRSATAFDIDDALAASLEGWSSYGS
jgi:hypothetical protein